MNLNQSVRNILAPAVQIARNIKPLVTKPAFVKPSTRTYYLGANGRVSQRRHLVGEVIATVRAHSTDQARFLFSDYEVRRSYPSGTPKPFIGEAVLCKCGWHHAKDRECPVCMNWCNLAGSVQTAPTMQKVV